MCEKKRGGRLQPLAYLALYNANLKLLQCLAGFVAVADILKRLGGILAGNIQKDFLAAAVLSLAKALHTDGPEMSETPMRGKTPKAVLSRITTLGRQGGSCKIKQKLTDARRQTWWRRK